MTTIQQLLRELIAQPIDEKESDGEVAPSPVTTKSRSGEPDQSVDDAGPDELTTNKPAAAFPGEILERWDRDASPSESLGEMPAAPFVVSAPQADSAGSVRSEFDEIATAVPNDIAAVPRETLELAHPDLGPSESLGERPAASFVAGAPLVRSAEMSRTDFRDNAPDNVTAWSPDHEMDQRLQEASQKEAQLFERLQAVLLESRQKQHEILANIVHRLEEQEQSAVIAASHRRIG